MKELVYIFLGGGLGSLLRYLVQLAINDRASHTDFPWSTFAVNVIGSLLIGVFYSLSTRINISNEVRLLLTAGLCGGFTTFSTFSYEGILLLKEGLYCTYFLYTGLSIIFGLLAVLTGIYLTGKI